MHLVYDWQTERLKLFKADGTLLDSWPCRNRAVRSGYYHWGQCPPGDYIVQPYVRLVPPEIEYGNGYFPIDDPNGIWVKYQRAGIYIHSGGTGTILTAPRQGWVVTLGCFRMQNEDIAQLVDYIRTPTRFTVTQKLAA